MSNLRRLLPAMLAACGVSGAAFGALVDDSLAQFDQAVRGYNLVTFGDAVFRDSHDIEGTMAIGGSLALNGNEVANVSAAAGNPALYVAGTLSVSSGAQAKLTHGYAALAGNAGWTWNDTQKFLFNGASQFSTINSSDALADVDPRLNSAPAGWNWGALYGTFTGISSALASAGPTGTIAIDAGQNFRLDAGGIASGVVVFDLDASLLSGNSYGGSIFSNISLAIPDGLTYVVNVRNAAGRTLFGSGANFNQGSGYDRLLWNIVDDGVGADVTFGGIFGAVLAPTFDVFHSAGTAMNGQVVAGSLDYSGAELHFTEFDYEVPEPGTYGIIGAALCLGLVGLRRRRRGAAR